MSVFQDIRVKTEQNVLMRLLSKVERNTSFAQRGWIRASQISPCRIRYYLTVQGFTEKSLKVTDYLSRSLNFFWPLNVVEVI